MLYDGQNKEILKAAREKDRVSYKEGSIRITFDEVRKTEIVYFQLRRTTDANLDYYIQQNYPS